MTKGAYLLIILALNAACSPDFTGNEGERETKGVLDDAGVDEVSSPYGDCQLYWKYEDEFTVEQKVKLRTWIENVTEAATKTIGQYPFDIWVTFHRSDSESSPVAFGHTERGKKEGVHFYVAPEYDLEELMADWTAPHEISHLSLPFSGRNNRWFSEGYATYLSRQIMVEMGYFTNEEFDSLYTSRIHDCMKYYGSCTKTHLEISDSLIENYNYGSMYWGSSSYFLTADRQLQEKHNMRFIDVVEEYQDSYRMKDKLLTSVIASYDNIIKDHLFNDLMLKYREEPSCKTMMGY